MSARYRMVIIHSVADYERWARVARENPPRDPRVRAMTVCRSVDDPNEVMVQLELDSVEAAKELISSTRFRELLDRAGVEIYPPVFVGEVVEDPPGRQGSVLSSGAAEARQAPETLR